jgi:hypothetical protein
VSSKEKAAAAHAKSPWDMEHGSLQDIPERWGFPESWGFIKKTFFWCATGYIEL